MDRLDVDDLTGLVLAGGRSRRFGTDKARHPVGERTMTAAVVAALTPLCSRVLVSLGAGTAPFDDLDVRYVRDQYPEAGPLAGLHAGLQACTTRWLLVAACDMPFLTPEALRRLLRDGHPSLQAVVATDSGGRLHPLCACYRRDVRPLLEAQLRAGHRAAYRFIEQLSATRRVRLPDDALRNINTPADLAPPRPDDTRP